ncbi:hypothetical protein C2E31_16575 [Rhodopirellula baltica]|nr:hypothetical protein C2E31_16575 [Rhodopirellula baltica]
MVMILILTSSALAAVHSRYLTTALQIEQARIKREAFVHGPVSVLAIACQRLETGDPPATSFDFRFDADIDNSNRIYRVTYQRLNASQWTVSAREDADALSLPPLPKSF